MQFFVFWRANILLFVKTENYLLFFYEKNSNIF